MEVGQRTTRLEVWLPGGCSGRAVAIRVLGCYLREMYVKWYVLDLFLTENIRQLIV